MIMRYIGLPLIAVLALTGFARAAGVRARTVDPRITVNRNSVREGGTVVITALIAPPKSGTSKSVVNTELWPYLNGKQWGAAEKTDRRGRAKFMIPLPNVGTARIQVADRQLGEAVFPVGQPLPAQALTSNTVSVRVRARKFNAPMHRRHLVGIEYEPWFTPLNVTWNTAEAIPLLGKYASTNTAAIRQQALWFDKMGINYIILDWSINLWGKNGWHQRTPNVNQRIAATTSLLKTYAEMRRQGIATPQVTLLLGLNNGPAAPSKTTGLNGETAWIYRKYIQNPRFVGLWLHYRHKPLIVIINIGGPRALVGQPPLHARQFTVRWMATQLQIAPRFASVGYWSWMDGSRSPIPTFNGGKCEALTITPAFFVFPNGGWLARTAHARDNGYTYIREFNTALRYRPHFLNICQWNEFAGQPIGSGYGPKHNIYWDCYDAPLSNDIEPTSLTDRGYRGHRGWGFYYLNLTRAFINLYRQKNAKTTLVAIGSPARNGVVKGSTLPVRWACVGKQPRSFTLLVDGKKIVGDIKGSARAYTLKLSGLKPGRSKLTLRADGAVSLFDLSYRRVAHRLGHPIPAVAQITFVLR